MDSLTNVFPEKHIDASQDFINVYELYATCFLQTHQYICSVWWEYIPSRRQVLACRRTNLGSEDDAKFIIVI